MFLIHAPLLSLAHRFPVDLFTPSHRCGDLVQCPEVDAYMSVAALPTFHVFHRGSKVSERERATGERKT
jgi:hypothetical protein